jgi:sec-independent protein translocase protein TatB
MLLDFGWSELMLIGLVALVVIGPKDLPRALRVAGYWVRKARTLSREFQSSVEQMVREAELDEVRQELKKAAEIDLDKEFRHAVDPTGSLEESLKPPELPNFSAPPKSGADATVSGATDAVDTAAGEPVATPEAGLGATDTADTAAVEPGAIQKAVSGELDSAAVAHKP